MQINLIHEALMYAVYFAPRGKFRLLNIGHQIAQRHLSPVDKLIGFIGDAGSGKSMLIKGMFPGLELGNDDEGINSRSFIPFLRDVEEGLFNSHTYHLDVRFESAFTQLYVIADGVRRAIEQEKRVIIEHFDMLYPLLGINAEILVGMGEEVVVTRPNIFGPSPCDIADIVFKSIKYRKMTHTAEDLTSKVIEDCFNLPPCHIHGDVKHGFVLNYNEKPKFNIAEVEKRVKELIDKNLDVCYQDEYHIRIGRDYIYPCTGPRIHVRNTGDIINFQLLKEFRFDPITRTYALVGLVGDEKALDINDLNKLSF